MVSQGSPVDGRERATRRPKRRREGRAGEVVARAALRFYKWRHDPVALLFFQDTKEDPYPLYDRVRNDLFVKSPLGPWLTARHAVASAVLRNPRFSSSPVHEKGYAPPEYAAGDPRSALPVADLLTMDPPDHTRIRRLVSSTFSPPAIAALEPFVRQRAAEALAAIDSGRCVDLVDAVAFPIPIAVICHLLGVPRQDEPSFRRWGHAVAASLDPQLSRSSRNASQEAEVALADYFRQLIERRRAAPDESLLSALIAAEQEGDRLSAEELLSTALLILIAGFETTVNLVTNGAAALTAAPEQWEMLHADPSLAGAAVEECLRFDSPVQMTSRTATEDLEVEGTPVPKGTNIIVALGGANRDPGVFSDPNELRIERENASRHLSFSLGLHHCLGAALARLEGRVIFEEMATRFASIERGGAFRRRPLIVLRGFEVLEVTTTRV